MGKKDFSSCVIKNVTLREHGWEKRTKTMQKGQSSGWKRYERQEKYPDLIDNGPGYRTLFRIRLQQLHQVEREDQTGEDDRNSGAQLDKDVQEQIRGILEGIADGVAHNGRLVLIGALATVIASLNVLLVLYS